MREIGFSTGAIALSDFRKALRLMSECHLRAVELSALRLEEVIPLVHSLVSLDLSNYLYISFHAPSKYRKEDEEPLVRLLKELPSKWPIVVHPDAIFDYSLWATFGPQLAIENMDKRKPIGRTAAELASIFERLPNASMCFDIGHARQYDASMSEAYLILKTFGRRIVQLHVSEVDTSNRHHRVSFAAQIAFQQMSRWIPKNIPLILESRVEESQIPSEIRMISQLFGLPAETRAQA
jgi:hypothetical protein